MSKFQLFIIFLTILTISCSRDMVDPPANDCDETISYENGVKEIIDATCSYSGCHDGSGGIGPNNYNTYAGMLAHLQSGSFENRVIDQQSNPTFGMPPDMSIYPQSLVDDLTEEQLAILSCWLEAGFPEN